MQYRVIKTIVMDMGGQPHKTYGIAASKTRIEDIGFDKRQVAKLARQFNRYRLDIIHFHSAVEDYLLKNCNIVN